MAASLKLQSRFVITSVMVDWRSRIETQRHHARRVEILPIHDADFSSLSLVEMTKEPADNVFRDTQMRAYGFIKPDIFHLTLAGLLHTIKS